MDPAGREPGRDRVADGRRRASRRSALRYYGALADSRAADILASSAAAGVLRPILSGGVSIVNARAAARERGIEIIESRSTRPRHYTSLVSLKLHTSDGERWAEGTVFEPNSPRLVSVRGITVEAPLAGTLLIICNDDQPGVIGEVGTILGRHGVNIANFALGRERNRRGRRRQRRRGSEQAGALDDRARGHPADPGGPRRLAGPAAAVTARTGRQPTIYREHAVGHAREVRNARRVAATPSAVHVAVAAQRTHTRSAPDEPRASRRVPPCTGSPST